jgi:hypothetical protein
MYQNFSKDILGLEKLFSIQKHMVTRKITTKKQHAKFKCLRPLIDLQLISIALVFFFTIKVQAQRNDYVLKDFKFEELTDLNARKDVMEKYACIKQSYTAIEFSSNLKNTLSNSVFDSFDEWETLFILPKMDAKSIWINDQAVVALENKISSKKNEKIIKEEAPLALNKEVINQMSVILSGGGDTLVLFPITVGVTNPKSGKQESRTYLYFQKLNVINKINQNLTIIKKVVQLEEHASILNQYGLELGQSDIDQFNMNIQNRVIDSINAVLVKLPKIYCVVANSIVSRNQFFKPLASAYIVLENDKNSFVSNEEKCTGFPKVDARLFDLTMTDSIEIYFDRNELIQKIRTLNYYEYFMANFTKKFYDDGKWQTQKPIEWEEVQYMYPIGYPKMDSTSILYHAEETWWGVASEYKKFGYRPEKLEFDKFFQKHVTNDTVSRQRLINLPGTFVKYPRLTWYSLIQKINYTENGLSINVKFGDPNEERFNLHQDFKPDEFNRNSSFIEYFNSYSCKDPDGKFGICAFDQDKLYQFYSAYMDIYERECNKIESIESNAIQNEEALQQEMIAKYGQKYVDAMLKLTIIVGMHEDLVKVIVNKLYYIESTRSTANQKCYRLDPKYGTGWVSVCIENQRVSSVAYY